jgi:tetratricopeptide (TPR) repeat protein
LRPRVILVLFLFPLLAQACATRPTYRTSSHGRGPVPPSPTSPQPTVPSAKSQASQPKPLAEEAKIKEQDLRERRPPVQEKADQSSGSGPSPDAPSLPDDSSLLAKITPMTSPQRAASIRLTEEGRKLLDAGEYTKALARLERTISIDSTNSYGYYYLAKAHYHLGHYQESLNFLGVAESRLDGEPFWLAEVFALKGENFRALGFSQKADSSYSEALRLNSRNRAASEGLGRLRGENRPPTHY